MRFTRHLNGSASTHKTAQPLGGQFLTRSLPTQAPRHG